MDYMDVKVCVSQGSILCPLLCSLYINDPASASRNINFLIMRTNMDKMIKVCEIFADKIGLLFNPLKSELLCYNVDNPDTVYVTLGNTTVRISLHEKHLGNFISNNIYDRNIKEHVC